MTEQRATPNELTVIPRAHREIYYNALLAGRDEAERLGWVADDRPFTKFHQALYRPMVDQIEGGIRRKLEQEGLVNRQEALIIGAREVCRQEGHKLKMPFYEPGNNTMGGVLGQNAPCDQISCRRCDVTFTATYPAV